MWRSYWDQRLSSAATEIGRAPASSLRAGHRHPRAATALRQESRVDEHHHEPSAARSQYALGNETYTRTAAGIGWRHAEARHHAKNAAPDSATTVSRAPHGRGARSRRRSSPPRRSAFNAISSWRYGARACWPADMTQRYRSLACPARSLVCSTPRSIREADLDH